MFVRKLEESATHEEQTLLNKLNKVVTLLVITFVSVLRLRFLDNVWRVQLVDNVAASVFSTRVIVRLAVRRWNTDKSELVGPAVITYRLTCVHGVETRVVAGVVRLLLYL